MLRKVLSRVVLPFSKSSSRTPGRSKIRAKHYWTVEDFAFAVQSSPPGVEIRSPVFEVYARGCDGVKRKLSFQLLSCLNQEGSDHISLFLKSITIADFELRVSFFLQVADGCYLEQEQLRMDEPHKFSGYGYGYGATGGWKLAFRKSTINAMAKELMPDGNLTIVCELEAFYRSTSGKRASEELMRDSETPGLNEDFLRLMHTGDMSDVCLACGGRRFSCHRLVLAARSDVFATMFSHSDTREALTGEVEIEDADPEVLEQFLQFMYSDRCAGMPELAPELLALADKYNVTRLKRICEDSMCRNIHVSNAVSLLLLAEAHNVDVLLSVALEFVRVKMTEVMRTREWREMCLQQPQLARRVMLTIGERSSSVVQLGLLPMVLP